jgi:murein L,D-transpeptidase YafK
MLISMGKTWKHILILSAITVFLTLIGFPLFYPVPSPPVNEVKYAQEALFMAGKNKSDTYSAELFSEANAYFDSAMVNWQKENKKIIYSRNYYKVIMYAGLSAQKANQASENSRNSSSNLDVKIRQKLNAINNLVTDLTEMFSDYPLTQEIRNHISKGKFLLIESELAYKENQYKLADEKLKESENLLTSSYENAFSNLRNYFRSYPEWKRLIDSTITVSKETSDYSIIVDKYSRKVFVYLNGEKIDEYSAELGKNWVGDKRIRGDKATPEGMYKITKKFKSDSTKYYKALLLDYPNNEDTANFEAAVAKGTLPKSAKIGEMIEIHGNGGRGADWTSGCIALTDREMDSIFKIAKIGTPVTIVGSMNDLKHVLKR